MTAPLPMTPMRRLFQAVDSADAAVEAIHGALTDVGRFEAALSDLAMEYVALHERLCGDDTDVCGHERPALDAAFALLLPTRTRRAVEGDPTDA